MAISCIRRQSSLAKPSPAGALLEVIWSAAPAAILAAMCSTSLKTLQHQFHTPSVPSITPVPNVLNAFVRYYVKSNQTHHQFRQLESWRTT
ncbi:MAG: hypothetical protein ACTS4U_00330 [Candidatus Hodgkinia cicadicola]